MTLFEHRNVCNNNTKSTNRCHFKICNREALCAGSMIFFIFEGSIAGGLKLVLNGAGFSELTTVAICSNSCPIIQSNYSSLTCKVWEC